MALADTARLVASLELQDKFSATANKYDKTLAGMERRTRALEGIGTTIGRGARTTIDNVKRIGVIAGGFVASQVALGVRSLAQLEEVQNQTEAVIKSTGAAANVTAEQIRAQAEALEDLSTVDDKAIQAGQNMLLTFTNIRNEVGEGNDIFNQATESVLDLSVAMGTEPKQAALQLGKALNDPVRGLTALRRVGIQFTDQQEKQIEKMVESGHTLEAQKVIIAELNKEFGGSAKAFGEGPGATMRRFGDAVEGAQQALATGFLPVMEKVSDLVQDTLKDPKVLANIEKFGEGLAGGVDDLIDIGMRLPWDAIGNSAKLMGQGAKALLGAFTAMPDWVQTAVLTGWGLNKLTGGALGSLAGQLVKGLLPGGALRGGTPATPVFTREVGPGGGGGGAPVAGGRGGTLGRIAGVGSLLVGIGSLVAAFQEFENQKANVGVASNFVQKVVDDRARTSNIAALQKLNSDLQGEIDREMGNPLDGILKWAFVNGSLQRQQEQVEAKIDALRAQSSRFASSAAGRWSKEQQEAYAQLQATKTVADRQNGIQQAVNAARERIGTGFAESNSKLGVIAGKDFSPNVAVSVTANTSVSISEVTRAAVSNSFASGFTPGLLNG